MATFTTTDAIGQREDLIDSIFDISPTDTPVQNAGGRERATAIRHEWQTDTLATATENNAAAEGADYTYPAVDPTVRPSNFTQILLKDFQISGTLEAVDKAGRDSEIGYQAMKRNKEIKRDREKSICSNNASVGGATRKMGGIRAWLKTNTSLGTGGADGGFNAGTGVVDAATDATAPNQRALTKALVDDVNQSAWDNGGEIAMIVFGSFNKRAFSALMAQTDVSQLRTNVTGDGQATLVGGVDTYISDFDDMNIVASRFSRARDALLLDPEYYALATLRPTFVDRPAKTGDAFKYAVLEECTLEMKNEAAHGVVADLTTS